MTTLTALAIFALAAGSLTGKVVSVHDGDTVTILDAENVKYKVRLSGIDAPELGQDFGKRSKQTLVDKIADKMVMVETHGKDRYGRTLGTIFIGERNVNLEMVAEGMAWWYKRYAPKDSALEKAESAARADTLGLWAGKPVEPWEWRKQEKGRRRSARAAPAALRGHERPNRIAGVSRCGNLASITPIQPVVCQ
jgi:endonuclease YncB( thermonuclease family)